MLLGQRNTKALYKLLIPPIKTYRTIGFWFLIALLFIQNQETHAASFLSHKISIVKPKLPMTLKRRQTGSIKSSDPQYLKVPVGGNSRGTPISNGLGMTTFDNEFLWQSIGITSGLNALGCIISIATGSHLHLDLIGTGAFAIAAIPSLLYSLKSKALLRVTLSSSCVIVWASKLAGFLFFRALKVKHDARLDETLSTADGAVMFWVISALWGIICALPHTLGTTSSYSNPFPDPSPTTVIGFAMFSIGFIIETLADYQKWIFKSKSNPGEFCNIGLWSISQHPNYFGNLMLWTGILILNSPALISTSAIHDVNLNPLQKILSVLWNSKRFIIALSSPLFMYALFYGQASGAMTNTTDLAMSKYGKNSAYLEYIEKVPLIVPNLLSLFGIQK